MAHFDLERFKRLPQIRGEIWQGGVFRMPGWVCEQGQKPYRLQVALWVSTTTGLVGPTEMIGPNDDAYAAAMKAVLAFGMAGESGNARPFALEVKDPQLADYLNDQLRMVGVRCHCSPRLPEMDQVLQHMTEHMAEGPRPPGAFTGKGVTMERMRAFADAAQLFYQAEPWQELSDDDLIRVIQPAAPAGMEYVAVMGAAGQAFGLAFFECIEHYEKMHTMSDPTRLFRHHGTWSFTYDDITELPFADADLWEDHGFPVADGEAYPFLCWFGPKKEMRRPDAKVLAYVEGLLRLMARTTHEQLDAGRWAETVKTAIGPTTFQLELLSGRQPDQGRPNVPLEMQDMRRSMEREMNRLQRLMEDKEFTSLEAQNAFLQANLNLTDTDAPPRNALEHAQELIYQAWETRGRHRTRLARQALEICPDCADAYVLLAEEARDLEKACELYRQGTEAGARVLGPATFEQEVGEFWGILETRPYMRSRAGLAQCRWELGHKEEAVAHYQELLRLNPMDNQGLRYLLAACLLDLARDEDLGKLLDQYRDDAMASWRYFKALWTFRREGDTPAARLEIKKALNANPHVPAYLLGRRRLPAFVPDSFTLGSKEEAICCMLEIGDGWQATPNALDWLKAATRKK